MFFSPAYFKNFSILYGSSFAGTDVCYQHAQDPATKMEVTCTKEVVAKYFRIFLYNQRETLALCELQIYGGESYILFLKIVILHTECDLYFFYYPPEGYRDGRKSASTVFVIFLLQAEILLLIVLHHSQQCTRTGTPFMSLMDTFHPQTRQMRCH